MIFRRSRSVPVIAAALMLAVRLFGDLEGSYVLPLDHQAIQYNIAPVNDRITQLTDRIRHGQATLEYDVDHGYLKSVLRALQIPVSSQVLVFSKSSFQAPRISPRTPRAVYFSDDVSVGWVPGGDVVEIASVDPRLGVVFYTIDQEKTAAPKLQRRSECLQCHQTGSTLGVPGLIVRSVFPERTGMPLFHAGGFITDHRSPLKERWGGWYVTGTHGSQVHMGNVFSEDPNHPDQLDRTKGANVTDLKGRFDTGAYLSPHSDLVALMVLEHQTRMTNLITRVGFETRMALNDQQAINKALGEPSNVLSESTARRINNAAESLVRYMLFTDEAPLAAPVKGTSAFAAEFAARGPRDRTGRSLRDFDLQTRMFRYPCSFLIYSEAFDGLPQEARDRVYRRLWEVLSGHDQSAGFSRLTAPEKKAVLEIVKETKPGLPQCWKAAS